MKAKKRKKLLVKIEPYVRKVQGIMRLDHWRIDLSEEYPDPGNNADIQWHHQKYRAKLCLSDEFLMGGAEDQRYTVVHEMLHLHLRDINLAVKCAWDRDRDRLYEVEELTVDALAQSIAPLVPLPQPKTAATG